MAFDLSRPNRAMFPHAFEDAEAPMHHRVFRAVDEYDRTRASILVDASLTDGAANREMLYMNDVVRALEEVARKHGMKIRLRIV